MVRLSFNQGSLTRFQSHLDCKSTLSRSLLMSYMAAHVYELGMLERRFDLFGTKCLCLIMGHRCYDDLEPNRRLSLATELRPLTSLVRER